MGNEKKENIFTIKKKENCMKKLLLISAILTSLPVFAACSIEEGATSCSIAQFQEPFQQTYSGKTNIRDLSDNPETQLQPIQNDAEKDFKRTFGPSTMDYSYNSTCQFGVCRNSGTPQLFQMRDKQ